ncbi:hypothetical protein P7K49_032967 [Saguinus oedipus]|uniref:PINIT domain-containing protein n=1 Tax=Saguinus oedipus TaxID=9490 RepID=A0ABQ9TR91_SAGOE|nr:hypothetical protein P7K49_032967 [Saguinus oedipus]
MEVELQPGVKAVQVVLRYAQVCPPPQDWAPSHPPLQSRHGSPSPGPGPSQSPLLAAEPSSPYLPSVPVWGQITIFHPCPGHTQTPRDPPTPMQSSHASRFIAPPSPPPVFPGAQPLLYPPACCPMSLWSPAATQPLLCPRLACRPLVPVVPHSSLAALVPPSCAPPPAAPPVFPPPVPSSCRPMIPVVVAESATQTPAALRRTSTHPTLPYCSVPVSTAARVCCEGGRDGGAWGPLEFLAVLTLPSEWPVCLQGYYPSNKPGVEPKRPCRPINLTHLMYLSSATNRITVTWGNYGKSYSVALYLVRQLTSSELLQRLKTIGVKHPELCKALAEGRAELHSGSLPSAGRGAKALHPKEISQGPPVTLGVHGLRCG